MTKIKLRIINFGYVMTVDFTIKYVKFQNKVQVLLKVTVQLHPNGPNELKLTGCIGGGVRIIPTKFELILKKFNF